MDTDLKNHAENILAKLGISPSSAVQMLYSQIVLHNGLPFTLKLPIKKPVAAGGMSQAELDLELAKGVSSLNACKGYTADEADAELARKFGI